MDTPYISYLLLACLVMSPAVELSVGIIRAIVGSAHQLTGYVSHPSPGETWTPVGILHAIVAAVANLLTGLLVCFASEPGELMGLPWELYALLLWPLPILPPRSSSHGNCTRYRCGHCRFSSPPVPWELYVISLRLLPILPPMSPPVGIVHAFPWCYGHGCYGCLRVRCHNLPHPHNTGVTRL
jgi:hypothetical protein